MHHAHASSHDLGLGNVRGQGRVKNFDTIFNFIIYSFQLNELRFN